MTADEVSAAAILRQVSELAVAGRWDDVLELVAAHDGIVNAVDEYGNSLLHKPCCYGGAARIVEKAIQLGADVNLESSEGSSPLGVAISGGHRYGLTTDENIHLLLAAGANLDQAAQNGNPPLLWAVYEDNTSAVTMLLAAGARPDQKNIYGETAYELASKMHSNKIAALLEQWRGHPSAN